MTSPAFTPSNRHPWHSTLSVSQSERHSLCVKVCVNMHVYLSACVRVCVWGGLPSPFLSHTPCVAEPLGVEQPIFGSERDREKWHR